MIHVAEDFFGGVNAVARGGKVLFEEFIECVKDEIWVLPG